MNYIRTSILRRKNTIQFLLCLFLVGIIIGIIFYIKQSESNKDSIMNSMSFFQSNLETKNINQIINHLIIITIIVVLAFLIIGTPIVVMYLFYEGLTIGFSVAVFHSTYQFKGLVFGLAFNFVTKGIYIILLILFAIKIIDISRNIIGTTIYKNDSSIKTSILKNSKYSLLLLGFILLNDSLLFVFGNKLMAFFSFLIT